MAEGTRLKSLDEQVKKLESKMLVLAEWWYNTSFHSSLGMTPFEALYSFKPPVHSAIVDQEPRVVSVASFRQNSVERRVNQKLSPRYYGPFQILEKIGSVAYKLELPAGSLVHPVFHVSQLKRKVGNGIVAHSNLPEEFGGLASITEPRSILDRKVFKKKNQAGVKWLVWWKGFGVEEATWEDADEIRVQFPNFDPDEDS